MRYLVIKTHAKNGFGLYHSGEIIEGHLIEDLKLKMEGGLVRSFNEPIFTKEEKKTRRK